MNANGTRAAEAEIERLQAQVAALEAERDEARAENVQTRASATYWKADAKRLEVETINLTRCLEEAKRERDEARAQLLAEKQGREGFIAEAERFAVEARQEADRLKEQVAAVRGRLMKEHTTLALAVERVTRGMLSLTEFHGIVAGVASGVGQSETAIVGGAAEGEGETSG